MGVQKKIRTVVNIVRQDGPQAAWKVFRQKFVALNNTDESEIILETLANAGFQRVMIDVGAHFGYCLTPFAQAGWKIFAFEPDPENRGVLLKNTQTFPTIHIDPRAVSDQTSNSASFYTSKESSGISSLSAFHPSHELALMVSVTTLDEFSNEQNLDRVDFLKIDTEGFDLMVLKGVPWERLQPVMILCEFEDMKTQKLGYSFTSMADYLVEKGYHVIVSEWHPIVNYGEQHSWRGYFTYPHQLHDEKAWGNLIATNDELLYQQLLKKCKKKTKFHISIR